MKDNVDIEKILKTLESEKKESCKEERKERCENDFYFYKKDTN